MMKTYCPTDPLESGRTQASWRTRRQKAGRHAQLHAPRKFPWRSLHGPTDEGTAYRPESRRPGQAFQL